MRAPDKGNARERASTTPDNGMMKPREPKVDKMFRMPPPAWYD